MVSTSPEIAYTEARKKLKSRFRRPAIIATDFENKLANWPKIANNDVQGLREFSDFLQQVEIAMNHLHSLKIFEYPSKLQTLVEKLPGWFLTKWTTPERLMKEGDVVLVCDNKSRRNQWPLAVVTKVFPSSDQLVRKVQIMISRDGEKKFYERPVNKLVLLLAKEDIVNRTALQLFSSINSISFIPNQQILYFYIAS